MHTLTILPRESYLRHRWDKDGICKRCGFDGASFMLWMQSDEAKAYHDSRFPTCGEEMMTNFETLQLDSPEIPELCRQKYRELIGRWPEPGEFCPDAAKWAMAWLSKPEAAAATDWIKCQEISDMPNVDEAMRSFVDDPTNDNAVCVVRAVLEAHHG